MTMSEDTEKPEKPIKTTVAVRLPKVPVPTHKKIKRFRSDLIKEKGRYVTITEAYYEYLRTK
jgi:hypothetical protein